MNRTIKMLLLSILLTFLLTGCGNLKQTAQSGQEEQLQKYTAEFYTLENVVDTGIEQLQLTEGVLYHIKQVENETVLYCRELDSPEGDSLPLLQFKINENPQCFAVTTEGEIVLVLARNLLTEDGEIDYGSSMEMLLCKYNPAGELIWEQMLPEDTGIPYGIHVDYRGQIYLEASGETVWIYTSEGRKQTQFVVAGIQNVASTGEGQLYVSRRAANNTEVLYYNPITGDTERRLTLSSMSLYHTGEELGFVDNTTLYAYDPLQDEEPIKLLNLLEYYVDATKVFGVTITREGKIYILSREGLDSTDVDLTVLTPEQSEGTSTLAADNTETIAEGNEPETESRLELKMAALNGSEYAQTIINYNRASNTGFVQLMDLGSDTEDMEMRIAASLLTSDAPDIVQIGAGYRSDSYYNYAKQGYLVDLMPYLERSEVLGKSDFVDRVLEDFTIDGKIYALPTAMMFETLMCPTEYTNGQTNWSIEEFLDFLEKHPNSYIREGGSVNRCREMLLELTLMCGLDAFVDREEGKACFDGERFRSLLVRIKELNITEVTETLDERVANGEVVLSTGFEYIRSNRTFANEEWKLTHGKEVTLMGFPTVEATQGEPGINSIGYIDILGITTSCEHPEEAWKFIERNLTKAFNAEAKYFPTGKDALEEKLQEETESEYVEEDEAIIRMMYGNEYAVGAITPEQVAKVRSGLENAIWYEGDVDSFRSIILEEAQAYFEDIKTLDEVVRIIQNRIQLYLDEQ